MDDFDNPEQMAVPVCLACGYDLRATGPGGTCPECGRARGLGLTRRDAVLVGVRLVAVAVVLHSLLLIDSIVWLVGGLLAAALPGSSPLFPGAAEFTVLLLQVAPMATRIVLAAALWWGSRRLTRRLVPHDGPVFGGDGPAAADLLGVGLVLLGVHLAAFGAAAVAVPLTASLSPDTPPLTWQQFRTGGLAEATVRLLLGLALTLARPLHRALARTLHATP